MFHGDSRLQFDQQVSQEVFGVRIGGMHGQCRCQYVDRLQAKWKAVFRRHLRRTLEALGGGFHVPHTLVQVTQVIVHEWIDAGRTLVRRDNALQHIPCLREHAGVHVVGGQFQVRLDLVAHQVGKILPGS